MFLSEQSLQRAIHSMQGTADHMLKIWFVLKAMGLDKGSPVIIDTANSTPALKRLFNSSMEDGKFFIPFAHTRRWAYMQSDASRSIIQTNIQRWGTSDSVVTCTPKKYLDITQLADNKLQVSEGRAYPLGLGHGSNGFARDEDTRVAIPLLSMAVWFFIREDLDVDITCADDYLKNRLRELLHLQSSEEKLIFTDTDIPIDFCDTPIPEVTIAQICTHAFDNDVHVEIEPENLTSYIKRVKNMVTVSSKPSWLQVAPEEQLKQLVDNGARSIVLYGPPRTSKTFAIDKIVPRDSNERVTLQMHEGWSYDNFIIGQYPSETNPGQLEWKKGAFLKAIQGNAKVIVLEEINRTSITQVLGEVFSLLEEKYRGETNAIMLPNNEKFFIPGDVTIYMTMNTIDSSTEDIDDALLGRCACVEFPPRVEALDAILNSNHIDAQAAEKIKELFNIIQTNYPLGHGYFSQLTSAENTIPFYVAKIRPVLVNHFQTFKPEVVDQIDNSVDSLFNA